jgi:hypothetical protein
VDHQLQQAVRILRAIRQRYETRHNAGSGSVRSNSVQVALGNADMPWITAVIEALEKADQILIGCMDCGHRWMGPRAADAPAAAALYVDRCGCKLSITAAPYHLDGDGERIEQ